VAIDALSSAVCAKGEVTTSLDCLHYYLFYSGQGMSIYIICVEGKMRLDRKMSAENVCIFV